MPLKEISPDGWNNAHKNAGALRELIEARFNQTIFIEALLMAIPNEEDHIFIAVSDMKGWFTDFSLFQEMISMRRTGNYKTQYFKTNNIKDLHELIAKIQTEQISDDSF